MSHNVSCNLCQNQWICYKIGGDIINSGCKLDMPNYSHQNLINCISYINKLDG